MENRCNPSLFQISTRIWLHELSGERNRAATFDEVPEEALDHLAALGFDWIWLLGVWQTGPLGQAISRSRPDWREEFRVSLPDAADEDITGSPFAVQAYRVHRDFGGDDALARFRERLARRGLRLLLDFVPNHTALDHPWVWQHPEFYIQGQQEDLIQEPANYTEVRTGQGARLVAHGRDPNFPGWPDTAQLNHRCQALRDALIAELKRIATQCDGVRCDMAMLLLPDVIERTWGERARPVDGSAPVTTSFWPAAIGAIRAVHPDFLFLAEVYWDLEWTLQQEGFDYTYDKRLYDRLFGKDAQAVRGHLGAHPGYQRKSVRFLENQDEQRAAAVFPSEVHQAAAVLAFLIPGLHFFHEGQLDGRQHRIPVHLTRRPAEPFNLKLQTFYHQLLKCVNSPTVKDGTWRLRECRPAWDDNPSWRYVIAFTWQGPQGERWLGAINYGAAPAQCYVSLHVPDLRDHTVLLRDQLSDVTYEREGNELADRGLYLDLEPWGYHLFTIEPEQV